MKETYKVWLFNYLNNRVSETILVEDFYTMNSAKYNGRMNLIGDKEKSYFLVRKYNTNHNNIIGGNLHTDTGTTVYDSSQKAGRTKYLVEPV